ncbi:MarR family winged helix-turn-helix transcriptional regulator [Arthrobacter sp. SLBN-112]|uniref:MarR family winged helix-turn-helix transcriptional regulator n=1 Tax=Arthrobacter sp. SLBN-112 TaxID=2768452 RepID=UPI0027B2B394|nr:MarR family winged helix-turn-helix transcriptional regulator [Arthrobacter sp. SLBN-112]MDQ0802200.1 DNA-binding MarR family transcriptional regulator [Arthrobacter sp. SLBN-112]
MPLDPGESPGFLLWHATLRWQRDIAAALAPLDLTHVQFVLLACAWWLNGQGEHPNQLALARQAGTDVKMASQVLRALEAKGLIEREVDPADTRAKRLRVTDAGAELAPLAIAAVELADANFFEPVPVDDALSLLRRLAHPDVTAPPTTTGGNRKRSAPARKVT